MGLAGLIMNVLDAALLKFGNDDLFINTMILYGVNCFILFIAGLMYFVERNNTFAQYYKKKEM
jgi:hypothetical protein